MKLGLERLEPLYSGKSKTLFLAGGNTVLMLFRDEVTAFNMKYRDKAPGKGELAAKLSAKMFEVLEGGGVRTHYICYEGGAVLRVRLAKVLPLEVIVRNYAYGSLLKRMPLLERMKPLQPPMVEFHYKSDELGDPLVLEEDIIASGLMSREDLLEVKRLALKVNSILKSFWLQRGLKLVDFKIEVAKTDDGFMVVDEVSGDTMRLVDGRGSHYDKEVYRSTRNVELLLQAYRRLVELAGEPSRRCRG